MFYYRKNIAGGNYIHYFVLHRDLLGFQGVGSCAHLRSSICIGLFWKAILESNKQTRISFFLFCGGRSCYQRGMNLNWSRIDSQPSVSAWHFVLQMGGNSLYI